MVTREQFETSKAIQRRTGRTFHVATRFLPERARYPTYVLYAFFRIADDVVDDPDPAPPAEQRAELDRMRAMALGRKPADDPILAAFNELRDTHGIADEEVETFIDAMQADIDPEGFETFSELEQYLRGSAVAVANMMLAVMAPDELEQARPHARALGEAFQLTNFLRDVREDVVEYDRVYLPRETLSTYGVATEDIEALRYSDGVRAAVQHELSRAESRYRDGVAGIRYLPESCQFPVLLSAVLYAEYHRLIRDRDYDVISSTPSLRASTYLRLVAQTWWAWRQTRDAESVFYRVSAISPDSADTSDAQDSDHTASGVLRDRGAGKRGPFGRVLGKVTQFF